MSAPEEEKQAQPEPAAAPAKLPPVVVTPGDSDMATAKTIQACSERLRPVKGQRISKVKLPKLKNGVLDTESERSSPVDLLKLGLPDQKKKRRRIKVTDRTKFTFRTGLAPPLSSHLFDSWEEFNMATITDSYYRKVDPAEHSLEVTRKRVELLGKRSDDTWLFSLLDIRDRPLNIHL